MSTDPHRPVYHFMPPSGWMNDPNGPITWRDGVHHLFYQYNPLGGWHESMHWGHARTNDLVHWEHREIAIAPGPEQFDKAGIYSGSAIDADGTPTIFYTGIMPEVQCVATSDETLEYWTKFKEPIVSDRPYGLNLDGFRDPTLWIDPSTGILNMGIGSGISGEGGIVLKYEARDGIYGSWSYAGILLQDEPSLGVNCECPDYFQFGDRWAMLASPQAEKPRRGAGAIWLTGEHDSGRFVPSRQGLIDASPLYYAPKSFEHHDGRRIVWGWLREGRSVARERELEWAGVMSLPREVKVDSRGSITTMPCNEVMALRGDRIFESGSRYVDPSDPMIITEAGDEVEIVAKIRRGDANRTELGVRCSSDGSERTVIRYDWITGTLSLDQTTSTRSGDAEIDRRVFVAGENPDLPNQDGKFMVEDGKELDLRVFVDHSVIEVFANGRTAITGRAYPVGDDSNMVCLASGVGTTDLVRLEAWQMENIWE